MIELSSFHLGTLIGISIFLMVLLKFVFESDINTLKVTVSILGFALFLAKLFFNELIVFDLMFLKGINLWLFPSLVLIIATRNTTNHLKKVIQNDF